jgi:hypothetical protein
VVQEISATGGKAIGFALIRHFGAGSPSPGCTER